MDATRQDKLLVELNNELEVDHESNVYTMDTETFAKIYEKFSDEPERMIEVSHLLFHRLSPGSMVYWMVMSPEVFDAIIGHICGEDDKLVRGLIYRHLKDLIVGMDIPFFSSQNQLFIADLSEDSGTKGDLLEYRSISNEWPVFVVSDPLDAGSSDDYNEYHLVTFTDVPIECTITNPKKLKGIDPVSIAKLISNKLSDDTNHFIVIALNRALVVKKVIDDFVSFDRMSMHEFEVYSKTVTYDPIDLLSS